MKSITISLILYASLTSAADLLGCFSSVNGNNQGTYKWQSSSYCQNECSDSPYFAMTNGGDCYCLTSKPSDETDSSDCDTPCFGWKTENCGGDSAYSVYVGTGSDDTGEDTSSLAAAAAASSTTSSSTSSTSTSSSTEPTSSAAAATTSSQEDNTSTSEKPSSTTDAPDSSATLVTTSSSNSEGHVIVKTVTKDADSTSLASATPTASSDSDDKDDNKKKSSNVGPIVGGVVGGVAGLAIIGFLAFFFVKRRRDQEDNDEEEFFDKPIGAMGGSINRNYGTGKSKKSVKTNALDMPMTNPFTHPSDNDPTALSDPRLNSVMMGRRRLSEGSLADETDYSRKILQVANPDD